MEFFEVLYGRRSIRRYTDEPVTDEDIQTLLRAAMYAPSARNCQPWDFIVIRDSATKAALAGDESALRMVPAAPVCIVVCTSPDRHTGQYPDFVYQDASAATQNLLLAARALGLGTVWCGGYPKPHLMENYRKVLGIPESAVPFALIAIGHPAVEKEQPDRFLPDRIHTERW